MSGPSQRALLAAQLAQTAALIGAAGWLLSHPVEPLPERTPPGNGPAVIVPGVPTGGALFATEGEALAAYIEHLDSVFDLETVLGGQLDIGTLRRAREAAARCEHLDCAGLDAYEALARALGRTVPPRPAWNGAELSARRAVAVYVDDIQRRLEAALPGGSPLLPTEAQHRAARDCPGFDCHELDAYLAAARGAAAAAGEPLPPRPELEAPTARRRGRR